ncbi:MAG TPA: HtaA domain-containing protein, partial [Microbacteriaceae bacterium]|nr:HtaA domain-containing protein [Microbacteriaceae bacterium]
QVQLEADGSFSFAFDVPASATAFSQPAIFTIRNHVDMADRSQDAKVRIAFASSSPTGPDPEGPGDGDDHEAPDPPSTPGTSLSISPSMLNPAVENTIVISGSGYTGPGAANGVYVLVGSSAHWQPGTPPPADGWIVSAWVTPSAISGGAFSRTLTIPAGAMVLGGSYGVGTSAAHGLSVTDRSLDRWAPIGLDSMAVATVATTPQRTAAPTPPATTGVRLIGSGTPTSGGTVTITASGFESNEQGVLVVVYSTPVVLGTADADATGTVTWTGKLPKGLTGKHTLTLQGSVNRGLELQIAAAAPRAITGCVAESVELTWGFKEAWRSYVSGTIAHGQWEVADGATYQTPNFGWQGTGSVNPSTLEGLLEFEGSIRFTGHDGVLDTKVIDPRIELDGDRATLLFDVEGENRAGEAVTQADVHFADLDLAAVEPTLEDGVLTIADIPAVLTAAGGEALSYAAGEPLDPITIVVGLGADCALGVPTPVATSGDDAAEITPISAGPDLAWLWWVLGAIALAIIVAIVVVVLRRRGAAE